MTLGTDANIRPKMDSSSWRLAMIAAGLEARQKRWPTAGRWPIALAGLSGGAKRSAFLAPLLAKTDGIRLAGLYITGINEDTLSLGVRQFHPPEAFHDRPIFISCGRTDTTSTPTQHVQVEASTRATGLRQVRPKQFGGDHVIKLDHLGEALAWFREAGHF